MQIFCCYQKLKELELIILIDVIKIHSQKHKKSFSEIFNFFYYMNWNSVSKRLGLSVFKNLEKKAWWH